MDRCVVYSGASGPKEKPSQPREHATLLSLSLLNNIAIANEN